MTILSRHSLNLLLILQFWHTLLLKPSLRPNRPKLMVYSYRLVVLNIPTLSPLELSPTSRAHNSPLCIVSLWAPESVHNFWGRSNSVIVYLHHIKYAPSTLVETTYCNVFWSNPIHKKCVVLFFLCVIMYPHHQNK